MSAMMHLPVTRDHLTFNMRKAALILRVVSVSFITTLLARGEHPPADGTVVSLALADVRPEDLAIVDRDVLDGALVHGLDRGRDVVLLVRLDRHVVAGHDAGLTVREMSVTISRVDVRARDGQRRRKMCRWRSVDEEGERGRRASEADKVRRAQRGAQRSIGCYQLIFVKCRKPQDRHLNWSTSRIFAVLPARQSRAPHDDVCRSTWYTSNLSLEAARSS